MRHRLVLRLNHLVAVLGLDRRDFVIFGSGPLLAHGLRREIRDLDVIARRGAWDIVSQHGVPTHGDLNGAPMAVFWGGKIQFSAGWISEDWDVNELIENAEVIDELPFARLRDVLRYKEALDRPKDRRDVRAIRRATSGDDLGAWG
ncbi:hypothetical protein [Symbioplanes lichenis]|uniref:hypothetical protein n=1 Tax=Symbioplanes lichenis TaxID=1629072 RepID=UPI00273866FD|nr:hypothetical protein [Actinoplanes lichenis]